jgi:hypothetical protein
MWPLDREIDIHQRNQPTRHLGPDAVIENEEPVPDFKLPVASLFD